MEGIGTFPISSEASAQLDSIKSDLGQGSSSGRMQRMMSRMTSWPVMTAAAAAVAGGAAFWWYRKSH